MELSPGIENVNEEVVAPNGGSIAGVAGLARGSGANEVGVSLVWTDERLLPYRHSTEGGDDVGEMRLP